MDDPAISNFDGRLSDGTAYAAAVPERWNGTLLLDLDFMTARHGASYVAILAAGYAAAGLARNYSDPPGGQVYGPWVERMAETAERVRAQIPEPDRVLAYGNSRGGSVALGLAKRPGGIVDGALVKCTHAGAVGYMNQILDLAFCLKALLAPGDDNLPVVNLSQDPAMPTPSGIGPAVAAWNAVLDSAGATPGGRARIALAAALAQANVWVDAAIARPRRTDYSAVVDGWVGTVRSMFAPGESAFFFGRPIFQTSARGNLSWNVEVDYGSFLHGATRRAIEDVYDRNGLDLARDIGRIETSERIAIDPSAQWYIERTVEEDAAPLRVPVLTMSMVGDPFVPLSALRPLQDLAVRQRDAEIFRTAFVEGTGHCAFAPAENLACLEALNYRLDDGRWNESTSPKTLNERAKTFGQAEPRFVAETLDAYNRTRPPAGQVPKIVDPPSTTIVWPVT